MMFIRMLFFSSVLATALLMGYKAGKTIDPLDEIFSNQIDTSMMPSAAIPDNDQFNLLVIGVDDINNVEVQLESIWLAAHAEDSNQITLIPVFPLSDDPDQNTVLSDSFSIEQDRPGEAFWIEMKKKNFWWKGYIIGDKDSAIRLIDSLGGIDMQSQHMDGLQAVNSIPSWKDESQISIHQQRIFFDSICDRFLSDQFPNSKMINDIVDRNSLADTRTKIFLASLIANIKNNSDFACNFPPLAQASSNSEITTE